MFIPLMNSGSKLAPSKTWSIPSAALNGTG